MPTTTIARVYANKSDADAVAAGLKKLRLSSSEYDIISANEGADMSGAISAAGVAGDAVQTYAKYVKDGSTLIVVRAGFGRADGAERLCDAHNPTDTGVAHASVFDAGTSDSSISRRPSNVSLLTGYLAFTRKKGDIWTGKHMCGAISHISKSGGKANLWTGKHMCSVIPHLISRT